jgi:hypothetical protein
VYLKHFGFQRCVQSKQRLPAKGIGGGGCWGHQRREAKRENKVDSEVKPIPWMISEGSLGSQKDKHPPSIAPESLALICVACKVFAERQGSPKHIAPESLALICVAGKSKHDKAAQASTPS